MPPLTARRNRVAVRRIPRRVPRGGPIRLRGGSRPASYLYVSTLPGYGPPGTGLLDEDGDYLLDENGDYLLAEETDAEAAAVRLARLATSGPGGGVVPPRWRVRIVGLDYAGKGELVSVSELEWRARFNDFDEVRFTVSVDDPAIPEFRVWTRWVEVWLDGDLKFRGFPVRAAIDLDRRTVQVQCYDQLFPFSRRVFGRADRPNLLTNGSFESGLDGWTSQAVTATSNSTLAFVSSGSKSVKVTDEGGYIWQAQPYSHTYPPGLVQRLAFDYYLPSSSSLPKNGVAARLLTTAPDGTVYNDAIKVTADDARDGFLTLGVDRLIATANETYLFEVRLYGCTGGAYFDNVRLVRNEATTVAFPGEDQAVAFRHIVEYGQGSSEGKSHLGISTDCPATGDTVLIGWPHADHRGLMSAIEELCARNSAPEWRLVYTPGATTFTTTAQPRTRYMDKWLLEPGRNIVGGIVELDGSQVTTSAIVLGDTGDFERDEGGYTDTSQFSGLVLETVKRAGAGTPNRMLDEVAADAVIQGNVLPVLPHGMVVLDPNRELIHELIKGDFVPVRFSTGVAQADTRNYYRVGSYTVPQSADRIMVDLAPDYP